ncbi:YbjQ family protein [Mycoplasmatota bacterium]|nr:YbjQ family protein [Mycoplasmatota bacterium]
MIIVNTDFVSGKTLETISLVRGSTIRSKHLGKDILSGLKTLVGGEITSYSKMLNEARQIATQRMVEEAERLDADAIINVRYSTSNVMSGAAEVLVYGTAVKFK